MNAMINITQTDNVTTVTLSNPDRHNAFDDSMIEQMTQAFETIAADQSVRLMILASSGKSFSAGADLNWMRRMADYSYEQNLADSRALATMLKTLNGLPKPTIAKVQGATFGGAVGLVSCCDIAVASESASFSLSEAKIGLIPATISPYVIAAIGRRAARRYFLTAERFSAKHALEIGLLSEVCTADDLDKTVDELASLILQNSPQAVQQSKQLIADVSGQEIDDALIENTCERIANIRVSDEGQEGLNAFLDKRPAAWLSKK